MDAVEECSIISRAEPKPYVLVYEPAGGAEGAWQEMEASTQNNALVIARDLRAHGAGFIALYERLGLCREPLHDGTGNSRWSWTEHLITDEV